MTDSPLVARLARALADGDPIDWTTERALAVDDDERSLVASLEQIALAARPSEDSWEQGESPPPEHPTKWGTFDLLQVLGRGAYGTVYLARDRNLDRDVALKLFDGPSDGAFAEEGRLLAKLRHSNIVCVYGADSDAGRDALWMELIHGRSFHDLVTREGPLGYREAGLVGCDVCSALGAVHAAGFVHGDISARNVMRERGGRVVLLDFSAGKRGDVTEKTRLTGTPLYLAPELLDGSGSPSIASDIYSVGVLLFYLVTASYPIVATTLADVRAAHGAGRRRSLAEARPDLVASFVTVVERALDPDPGIRFATSYDFARALRAAAADSAAPSAPNRGSLMTRPVPMWMSALFVLAGVFATWLLIRPAASNLSATAVGGGGALTSDQWSVLSSYRDLADDAAERGAWASAVTHYEKASELLSAAVGDDEPIRAVTLAGRAWALSAAGRLGDAHQFYDLALYKLAQEAGTSHPLIATFELARAQTLAREGRMGDASAAVTRALSTHRMMLAGIGIHSAAPAPVIFAEGTDVCADGDGDWLLDALEGTHGLDPARPDTDSDGQPDGEEDTDADGVVNALAWPYGCDPRRVVAHYQDLDPLRIGFRQERRFRSQAVKPLDLGNAWQVDSEMGFYYSKLTEVQKKAAMSRGWRLRSRMAFREGAGFVSVDLVPHSRRFDQWFFAAPDGKPSFFLASSIMPRQGSWLPSPSVPLVEYVFDPSSNTARVLIDGRTVRTGYGGQTQYQEDFGLFFGTNNDMGATRRGVTDFALAWLAIR